MTNRRGTLYTGVTNDLLRRVTQHKRGESAFTSRYRIGKLVYYETTRDIRAAIEREKQIKGWTRAKKVALVTAANPAWKDLWTVLFGSRL
jgi:putative endonuclease